MKEEQAYYDNLWNTHYANKLTGNETAPENLKWGVWIKDGELQNQLSRQAREGMDIMTWGLRDLASGIFYNTIYAPSSLYWAARYDVPRYAKRGAGMFNYEEAKLKAERAGNKVSFMIASNNYTGYNNTEQVCQEVYGGQLASINTQNEADMFEALL